MSIYSPAGEKTLGVGSFTAPGTDFLPNRPLFGGGFSSWNVANLLPLLRCCDSGLVFSGGKPGGNRRT